MNVYRFIEAENAADGGDVKRALTAPPSADELGRVSEWLNLPMRTCGARPAGMYDVQYAEEIKALI